MVNIVMGNGHAWPFWATVIIIPLISASAMDLASAQENNCAEFGAVRLISTEPNVGESIFATDLSGVQSVVMAGIILMLHAVVCRELGIQQIVSLLQ